ncbi:MAG: hypothetical protein F6K22_18830, partial [Okeania sp. SIO2F4]|nr:hypothetical protein [Okeania sp. SIO2F4]
MNGFKWRSLFNTIEKCEVISCPVEHLEKIREESGDGMQESGDGRWESG